MNGPRKGYAICLDAWSELQIACIVKRIVSMLRRHLVRVQTQRRTDVGREARHESTRPGKNSLRTRHTRSRFPQWDMNDFAVSLSLLRTRANEAFVESIV